MTGISDKLAQPILATLALSQSGFDALQHVVDGGGYLSDLSTLVSRRHPLGKVHGTFGQRQLGYPQRGRGNPGQRPQRAANGDGADQADSGDHDQEGQGLGEDDVTQRVVDRALWQSGDEDVAVLSGADLDSVLAEMR